ncbi:MAG TPA: TM0106 family RecB-like putative nuclease [Mucilaginibacter sp.]|jgi:predicted RecB family nuclease
MYITNEIIENYFECNYKSYLKLRGVHGEKCDLESFQISHARLQKLHFFNDVLAVPCNEKFPDRDPFEEIIRQEKDYIFNIEIQFEGFKFHCDFLKKVSSQPSFKDFHYIPALIVPTEHIPRKSKIMITGIAYALSKIQSVPISFAEIIYGRKFKLTRIKVETYLKEFHKVANLLKENDKFLFHLNSHCSICEFSKTCREKAVKEDHLSLLKGITRERIKELNNKGIFSINQLSYTFRPKRKPPKGETKKRTRSVELQALAIREKKIFIYDSPPLLPNAKVEMFLDIEGLPDDNFYYLIGLTIKIENEIKHHHFWANNRAEQLAIVKAFLSIVLSYDDFVIYHYGSYETIFLHKMKDQLSIDCHDDITAVIGHCYNILSILYAHIYFPTYSNGLKEIGKFIGFSWTAENASGIESIFWRKTWDVACDDQMKEKLITYNKEDCLVLSKLKAIINAVIVNNREAIPRLDVGNINDLQKDQKTTFIVNESFFPEIKFINECSYFDYQREKVYAKTNPSIKKIKNIALREKKYFYDLKPNKIIDLKRLSCDYCKSEHIYTSQLLSKKIIDLKFSGRGVNVLITQYNSYKYGCMSCKNKFIPAGYPTHRIKLGHNLIAWAIYQHIVNKQGFRVIENNFRDLFHLYLSRATFFACKDYFIRYYGDTYDNLLTSIIKSDVLYVDETPFTMQFEKGYVWVFTNGVEVVSIYKPNREASFLKEFLQDFEGVLVTDFYNGYDSIKCLQQKCLIHLIRDFNSDLIRNPFNEEFKRIAKEFTTLLQKIVSAIDRFGLTQYHLNRYKKEADKFFTTTLAQVYQTEIAQQYQTRLKRNRNTLFEFLNHNNVSWNNSNAEHAIKILALHANKNINSFRKSRIDEYLKIMSIYQTCEYKNIGFLKFLISQKTGLNDLKK